MPFSNTVFDPETLALMAAAYERALDDLKQISEGDLTPEQRVARDNLATRIIAAAEEGERDPERLREIALGFTMSRRTGDADR